MILRELGFLAEAPPECCQSSIVFRVVSEKQPNLDPFFVSSLLNCHERT